MESNPTIEKIKIIGDSHFDIHFTQDLGELFTALAKAQAIMMDAKTDSKNPLFKSKYADLSSVVKASRKPLTENGLAVTQFIREKEGKTFLFTRLGHTSGQWLDSFVGIQPPKEDIQSLGSYLTYLRRYPPEVVRHSGRALLPSLNPLRQLLPLRCVIRPTM